MTQATGPDDTPLNFPQLQSSNTVSDDHAVEAGVLSRDAAGSRDDPVHFSRQGHGAILQLLKSFVFRRCRRFLCSLFEICSYSGDRL